MDKQIEEMTKDLQEAWLAWSRSAEMANAYGFVAKILAKKWQRKIPEGAVVLTKEEAERYIYIKDRYGDFNDQITWEDFIELMNGITQDTRKETAEKFAERMKAQYPPRTDKRCTLDDCYMLDKIDEIAKEIMEG